MTDDTKRAFSPTGSEIIATADMIPGNAMCKFYGRNPDGTLEMDYTGDETRMCWDGAITKTDDRGQTLYVARDGTEWPEDSIHLEGEEPRSIPPVTPSPGAVTIWTLTTDGDDLGIGTEAFATEADALAAARDVLRTSRRTMPSNLDTLDAEAISELWAAAFDGACIIDSHDVATAPVAPSPDWRSIARHLAGALDACTHQIGQMSGMFDDEDGTIAEAVEDADAATEAYRKAAAGLPVAPAPLAVVVEQGLVARVMSDNPGLIGAPVLLIDHDTEGADTADVFQITANDGNTVSIVGHIFNVETADVPLPNVMATMLERGRDLRQPSEGSPGQDDRACAEGWGLFQNTDTGSLEIQADAESDIFARDGVSHDHEAEAFVKAKAAEGSEYHIAALAKVGTAW